MRLADDIVAGEAVIERGDNRIDCEHKKAQQPWRDKQQPFQNIAHLVRATAPPCRV